MKVVAKTGHGFLVEMTTVEIARAAGYESAYDREWNKAIGNGQVYSYGEPAIGATINVGAAYDIHSRILANEAKAKESAATLRALAELLDGAMPSVVIPPAEAAKPEDQQ